MSSTVIPTLRYRNASAAIDFLTGAFGFEAAFVVEAEDGSIEHAQLVRGPGMFMIGDERDDEYSRAVESPVRAGGVYVVVADVAAHAERARAEGAEIVVEPAEQDYGGANYTARDLEGNIWSFGSYDPWADL